MVSLRFRKKERADPEGELLSVLGTSDLPTFPAVVLRTLEVLRQPESSAADVASALAGDPGLTVRLLRLVNSAGFNPSRPVNSVHQAVAVAGYGAIESMVLSVGVTRALPSAPIDGYDHARFWRAASRRATVARAFAAELHPPTASLSFTAGLLQDMAVPLLAAAREDYRPVLEEWHGGGDDLHRLEQESFDWTHCRVATWLCDHWELPPSLAEAISGHHFDHDSETPPGVLLAAPLREVEPASVRDSVVTRAVEEYGLSADQAVAILDDAEVEAAEVAALFL
jgi:HD-like signal output (HDOD) protein